MRSRFAKIAMTISLALGLAACGGVSNSSNTNAPGMGNPGDPAAPANPSVSAVPGNFDSGLVQVSQLEAASRTPFGAFGSDPLGSGRVHVENDATDHEMQAKVNGAIANSAYSVSFCSFASGLGNCRTVASVMTDGQGNGEANLTLPAGAFAGIFLWQRMGANQFVTGFPNGGTGNSASPRDSGPGNGNDASGNDQQRFKISLEPAGAVSGGLGAGFSLGSDTLSEGSVRVEPGHNEAQVEGAPANVTYSITFCRFGTGASGCTAAGSLATNNDGEGHASLTFVPSAPVAGVFVLSRSVSGASVAEFVTGFRP